MTGIGSTTGADSNGNELEPESLSLVVKKEPKSDSKAGITPALVESLETHVNQLNCSMRIITSSSVH